MGPVWMISLLDDKRETYTGAYTIHFTGRLVSNAKDSWKSEYIFLIKSFLLHVVYWRPWFCKNIAS